MKYLIYLTLFLFSFSCFSQNNYRKYFKAYTFRFDFQLGGNADTTFVFPVQMKKEGTWAGTRSYLISPFNDGNFRYCIFDASTSELIFSNGFCPLYHEWQATSMAKTEARIFYNVITFPFPKHDFILQLEQRNSDGIFNTIYKTEIDIKKNYIVDEKNTEIEITKLLNNGPCSNKVDIAILAEGYTFSEKGKFIEHATEIVEHLFQIEPFKSMKDYFNVNLAFTPSQESGTDIPAEGVYKKTIMDFSFYTFNEPRYITSNNLKMIYDLAANVTYDHIVVLINSERYGGGGFYNFYSCCTSINEIAKKTFVHEFGHGFAGLGDEYYTSSVPLDNFYNLQVEPWEPNLTTMVDFESKWGHMLEDSIPVPTPRKKRYENAVGVYEGGGYCSKGIYSPMMNCIMKELNSQTFCPVCKDAIQKKIHYYTK